MNKYRVTTGYKLADPAGWWYQVEFFQNSTTGWRSVAHHNQRQHGYASKEEAFRAGEPLALRLKQGAAEREERYRIEQESISSIEV